MIFYHPESNTYPRFMGDMISLGWNPGEELPDGWVEVEYTNPPEIQTYHHILGDYPEFIDGRWIRSWNIKILTEEEIALIEEQQNL